MGFRTGVRLPSDPLQRVLTNTCPSLKTGIFKTEFGISVRFEDFFREDSPEAKKQKNQAVFEVFKDLGIVCV